MPSQRTKNLSEEIKKRIVQKKNQGFSHSQIARELFLTKGTVSSFFFRLNQNTEERRRGRTSVANEEIKMLIIRFVEENNAITLQKIKINIRERTEKSISISTISRILIKEKFIFLRVQLVPAERNSLLTIEKRYNYVRAYSSIIRTDPSKSFIFLDESGFDLFLKRTYGRERPGRTPIIEVPASRGRNMTLILAIDRERPIYWEIYDQNIDARTFKQYLNNLKNRLGNNFVLVMDNARIHHANEVQEFLSENELPSIFLPPYSPFLNPIEECFALVKNKVRDNIITTTEELIRAMDDAIRGIRSEDFRAFFLHTETYFERCEMREIINN